ncbi:MAG TPA: ATP-binding protein, partial [Polyangiaceae bacterium]|nr:ATP-binding protein [Polyangiaceae bacterium]
VLAIAVIDRSFALQFPGPDTGWLAGVVALLAKLVLAGGLGLVLDARGRERVLNAQLHHEIEVRQRSEASLHESEGLHRALVQSLAEGVGLFDAEDRVVFANQALAALLSVAHEDLLGQSFLEFLVLESRERIQRAHLGQGTTSYEVVLRDAASTLLLVTETRFDQPNAQGAVKLRVVRDLTERVVSERRQRDLERELERSQSLQSLAIMAGGVAHDFNNLLCGVVGNAEVAQRRVPADAPPLLTQCLSEIVTYAEEAAQLSKQMLAYAGNRSLAIEALDPNVELLTALRLLHATVESKARLVLDLGESLPEVAADRFKLRQIVTNLVLNALDAMDGRRGLLTLQSGFVRLTEREADQYDLRAGDYIKVTVTDTGSGVPAELRERLFEPFFSTKALGRGMGLAAALGIARAHQGWLGIEATSEAGTSFGILLPAARESTPRRASVPSVSSQPPAARNILLIDAEPAVRAVTARLLGELGQRVVTADSGKLGLELFSQDPSAIDLVVLDLTMPEQSGEQILDALRSVRHDVPVVITSGFLATDASKLLGAPNVIGFLNKPHTLTSLEMVLASIDPSATRAAGDALTRGRFPVNGLDRNHRARQ